LATTNINGLNVMVVEEAGPLLGSEQDALDLVGATYGLDVDAVAVPAARFSPGFFDLSTKMAGLFFQKLQNYRLRLAIVGDLSEPMGRSKALADFVGETNRVGHHFFAADRAALDENFGRRD
jgi:hypothetical protein